MIGKVWLTNYGSELPLFDSVFTLFIGRPKPSKTYTVEQLESMGLIGVYRDSDNMEVKANEVC